jgi:hypothetical protein
VQYLTLQCCLAREPIIHSEINTSVLVTHDLQLEKRNKNTHMHTWSFKLVQGLIHVICMIVCSYVCIIDYFKRSKAVCCYQRKIQRRHYLAVWAYAAGCPQWYTLHMEHFLTQVWSYSDFHHCFSHTSLLQIELHAASWRHPSLTLQLCDVLHIHFIGSPKVPHVLQKQTHIDNIGPCTPIPLQLCFQWCQKYTQLVPSIWVGA